MGRLTIDPDGLRRWLRVLFTPMCWFPNHPYSRAWDLALRDLMVRHEFRRASDHTATIGGVVVWVSNHPYASMTMYPEPRVRPSRATTLEAYERYTRDCLHGSDALEESVRRILKERSGR